jgi:LysM repeat protein
MTLLLAAGMLLGGALLVTPGTEQEQERERESRSLPANENMNVEDNRPHVVPGEEPPLAEPGVRYAHTVADGESLSGIAARAGLALDVLAERNRLQDPDRLLPGTELRLRPLYADAAPAGDGGRDLLARLAPADVRIEIRKSERRLELRLRGRLFRVYRAALGHSPVGDKRVEGDGRTPEGGFFVCQRLARGRYGPSLGLSYPDAAAAERGRLGGLVTAEQYDAIVRSLARREKPPWDTPLGGAICIHGRGSAADWTAGCVALDDADAGELFALTPMGAAVGISP